VFSGIVRGVGRIVGATGSGNDRRIVVGFEPGVLDRLPIGASIAVNGACLTAVESAADRFAADVSAETLAVTTLGELAVGARVNLEPPLKLGDTLDGHLVTGHVDGIGRVVTTSPEGRSVRLTVEVPAELARYVARKGSVAIDGVSLTVNGVAGNRFEVNVIPHTQAVTIIGEYAPGRAVNIEVDLIARYLERLDGYDDSRQMTLQFLKDHGYARNH
jgi:riboflavin synthase